LKEANINNKWPFVRGSIPFIGIGFILTLFFICLKHLIFSIIFGFITCFIAFFFRDPERVYAASDKEILAPADGRIIEIKEIGDHIKVSIFMSLLDVHVNRIPISGIVKEITYYPGKFLRADLEKASYENEKNKIVIIPDNHVDPIMIIQIAGIIARRIICWIKKGDRVTSGQRFGLICFGSRVEVYIDKRCNIIVKLGQKVKAGLSIIGYMP